MRTHILIALLALVVTACASKQYPSAAQQEKQEFQSNSEYVQIMDGASNRGIR